MVRGVGALVTSATGYEDASQPVAQPISLRYTRHTLRVFVFRGHPTRAARRTTDRSACAKGPLCVSTDGYPDRVTTVWIERQLSLTAIVRDDEIIA